MELADFTRYRKVRVWYDHPCHEELLPKGRKRYSKSCPRPKYSKGKVRISKKMAEWINKHRKSILNGVFRKRTVDYYLCASCLCIERSSYIGEPSALIDIDEQRSLHLQFLVHDGVCEVNSPMDHDSIRMQQIDIKKEIKPSLPSILFSPVS